MRSGRSGQFWIRLIAAIFLFFTGCEAPVSTNFLIPPASVNNISCIAVLPLKNDTQNPNAGSIISDVLSIDLMKYGGFNVMDRMEVERVLKERDIFTPDGISPNDAQGAGIILGVQAVFTGEVKEYFYKPSSLATQGAVPTVSLSLSLIDAATGQVIWTGNGTFTPSGLIAAGTTPITDVVQEGVSELLDTFYDGIGPRPATPSRVCWYDPNTLFARLIVTNQPAPQQPQAQPQPSPGASQQQVASVQQPEYKPQVQVPPAKVSVLNASGNPKASMLIGVTLIKNKINVVNVSVEKSAKPKTTIYYRPDYYDQALRIAKLLKKKPQLVQSGAYKWDITLIVGRDLR